VLLGSLGVSYVISGDYSGWNYGLAHGGWGGLAIASIFGAVMYAAVLASLAELATVIPAASGGAAFAAYAFGPRVGGLAGLCIWLEYTAAAGVIAMFLEAHLAALFGINGLPVLAASIGVLCAIHCAGVGEALRFLLAVTTVAIIGLVVFVLCAIPHFSWSHLFDAAPGQPLTRHELLPSGWWGVWAAFPFGTAFFLGVEGVALAAEETRDVHRNLPRGMIASFTALVVMATLLVLVAPGTIGSRALANTEAPLIDTLNTVFATPRALPTLIVNGCAVAAFVACLFSALYGCSRVMYALARTGDFPSILARTNRRKAPFAALITSSVIAFALSLTNAAEQVFVLMVSAGTLSYLLMLPAHWTMRMREPNLTRAFRTPGGSLVSGFAWIASLVSFVACFLASPRWSSATIALVLVRVAAYRIHRARPMPEVPPA
jgi:ethanolamine permease